MATRRQRQGGRPIPRQIRGFNGPLGSKTRVDGTEVKVPARTEKVEWPDTPRHDVARARLDRAVTTGAGAVPAPNGTPVPKFMRASINAMPGQEANCLPLALGHVAGAPPNPAEAANLRGTPGSTLTQHADKIASGLAGETYRL